MIKIYILGAFIVLLLASCCKPIIETQTLYNNTTDNKIELRAFNKGVFNTSFIEPKSTTIAFFVSLDLGISVVSVMLLINGKHEQTHYAVGIRKPVVIGKVFEFENPKNLLNFANYQKSIEELSCNGSRTKYIYTF